MNFRFGYKTQTYTELYRVKQPPQSPQKIVDSFIIRYKLAPGMVFLRLSLFCGMEQRILIAPFEKPLPVGPTY